MTRPRLVDILPGSRSFWGSEKGRGRIADAISVGLEPDTSLDDPGQLSLVACVATGAAIAVGVAAETALFQYSHGKLEKMLGSEELAGQVSKRLRDFERQTFALTLYNALCTVLFVGLIFSFRDPGEGNLAAWITALLLVVGILRGGVRALVAQAPERVLLLLLGFIVAMDRLLRPVTVTLSAVGTFLATLFGFRTEMGNGDSDVHEEILDAVAESEAGGDLEPEAATFIENIVEIRDQVVREIMTPRTSMVSAPANVSLEEAIRILEDNGHSRVPVYEENRDHIIGMLYFKDVLGHIFELERGEKTIRDLVRDVYFVPETKKITDLLKEFQQRKLQVAVVIDEFGGTAGLVTVEDILEEIVGELQDEFDPDEESEFREIDPDRLEVKGTVSIDDLEERLHLEIPDDGDYDTLGGFLAAQLGKVPSAGENLIHGGIRFEVLDADERKVNRVLITRVPVGEGKG
ncbi:MAG TPA: HlyC/CorC family transporter [Planctomycetes bacterium]|nr:HlyC/CorC family transporter [Planctomycetota bacterium]